MPTSLQTAVNIQIIDAVKIITNIVLSKIGNQLATPHRNISGNLQQCMRQENLSMKISYQWHLIELIICHNSKQHVSWKSPSSFGFL